MINNKNNGAKFIAEIIALVNSVILFVQSIKTVISTNATHIDYYITCLYLIFLIVTVVMFLGSLVNFIKNKRYLFKVKEKQAIAKSLVDFMDNGGRTAILSRNLSWITDEFIGKLEKKAKGHELIIFIPCPNETSERLRKVGADVRYFNSLISDSADNIIKSRFTIIQWDSTSARITYPKEDHLYHYNFEYVIGDPTMDLAQDLIRLLIKLVPENQEVKYEQPCQ